MKPHTAGIFAALTTLAGIAASPEVLNVLPAKWAAALTIGGVVLQSVTKGVQHGDTAVVPKDEAAEAGLIPPRPRKRNTL